MPISNRAAKPQWSKSLELPDGYQNFSWYKSGLNPNRVYLNDPDSLCQTLEANSEELYLYTHHQVFYDQDVIKHTRSSPQWEGGLVTYSTCKHLMRTYSRETWVGTWLVGLAPAQCASNCMLYAGRVFLEFPSNYELSAWVRQNCPTAWEAKQADNNPRADLYTPSRTLELAEQWNHNNYEAPPNHTRSLELYKKSPGSTSERPDGKVPKWWRDLEYLQRGHRPRVFVLQPCWLFSGPALWTSYRPLRASLRLTTADLVASLGGQPNGSPQAT